MQFNESGEIRTLDRPLRRRMLYPAELPIHYSTTIFIVLYLFWHVNYFFKKVSFKQKDALINKASFQFVISKLVNIELQFRQL